MMTKQKYEIANKINWAETKCVICDFKLSIGACFGPQSDDMIYHDFVVRKEHLFLRNIYDTDVLKEAEQIKDLKTYYEDFKRFVNCATLIGKYYNQESDIYDIDHYCVEEFLRVDLDGELESFEELYDLINETKIKKSQFIKKSDQNVRLRKIISFVYLKIMSLPKNELVEETVISTNFLQNITNIMYDKHVIHHSHMTGEIIGYAHGFCNRKVRENKNNISVIAHNFFGFDFFFFLKGIS